MERMKLQDMDVTILKPSDVLVLKPKRRLTFEEYKAMGTEVEEISSLTGCKIIVVPDEVDVYAVRQES